MTSIPTHDASSSATGSSGTTLTWSHTVSGSDRLLLVAAVKNSATGSITGVTYNGVALALAPNGAVANGNLRTEWWYLKAPDTGAHNVVVTWSADPGQRAGIASSYNGVSQTHPFFVDVTAHGTGTSSSPAFSTPFGTDPPTFRSGINTLALDVLAFNNTSSTALPFSVSGGTTQNAQTSTGVGAGHIGLGCSRIDSATNTSRAMAWSLTVSKAYCHLGVALRGPADALSASIEPGDLLVAYDDTDGTINHFKPDGTHVQAITVDYPENSGGISGFALDMAAGRLYYGYAGTFQSGVGRLLTYIYALDLTTGDFGPFSVDRIHECSAITVGSDGSVYVQEWATDAADSVPGNFYKLDGTTGATLTTYPANAYVSSLTGFLLDEANDLIYFGEGTTDFDHHPLRVRGLTSGTYGTDVYAGVRAAGGWGNDNRIFFVDWAGAGDILAGTAGGPVMKIQTDGTIVRTYESFHSLVDNTESLSTFVWGCSIGTDGTTFWIAELEVTHSLYQIDIATDEVWTVFPIATGESGFGRSFIVIPGGTPERTYFACTDPPSTGMVLWFKADRLFGYADLDDVDNPRDYSPAANQITTWNNSPTFHATGGPGADGKYVSLESVPSTTAGSWFVLDNSFLAIDLLGSVSEWTVYAVFRTNAVLGTGEAWQYDLLIGSDNGEYGTNQAYDGVSTADGPVVAVFHQDAASHYVEAGSAITLDTWFALKAVRLASGTVKIATNANGDSTIENPAEAAGPFSAPYTIIGFPDYDTPSGQILDLAELIVYDHSISVDDAALVAAYFDCKYGLLIIAQIVTPTHIFAYASG